MARILVIDDDADIRALLHKALTRAGHEVGLAADGNAGLAACRQGPPHLVITDIVMPDKEGLSTIQQLHRDYPRLKIIAMSGGGYGTAHDYLKASRLLGAHRVFEKPVEWHTLLLAVEDLLRAA